MIEQPDRARLWAIELGACLVTALLLGAIGPFGSFLNDVLIVRVAYWVIVFLSCAVGLGVSIRVLAPRARSAGLPPWAWASALLLAVALPLTAFTRMVAIAFWPAIGGRASVVDWYGQTLLMALVYMALHVAVDRLFARPAVRPEASPPGDRHILRHLPPRLGGDLLCLSMEDHYVRLHAVNGSVLVLMSLRRAMQESDGIDGLQVHRSWWVARHAVVGVIEDGRNLRLRLKGGLEAPVSRTSVARLRQAGWLQDG